MSDLNIQKLAKELRTQDNLGTAHPIFIVRERIKRYGLESDYSELYDWFDPSEPDCIVSTADLEDENGNPMTEEQAEEKGFIKFYYEIEARFRNAHFTRKAAEQYISENSHNLTDPYVFVETMYRCPEMIAIREFLMNPQDTFTTLEKLRNAVVLSTYDHETKCCKICGAGDDGEHDANCPAFIAAKFVADFKIKQDREGGNAKN